LHLSKRVRNEGGVSAEARVETLTVLFTDVVESTAMRVRLGEEEADKVRQRHDALLARSISEHRGRLVKHTGDGVMATFEGASDAIAAAVAIQQAIETESRGAATEPLQVRVGISVGDVSAEGDDCFGLPVVEAQRLENAARPGQILCSSIVRTLARGRGGHTFTNIGALTLKGLDEPVDADEVAWEPIAAPGPDELPPVLAQRGAFAFAGRTAERERVLEHWSQCQAGATKVVLLAGEPGVGKTRLASEIALAVQQDGGLVLAGRCDELVGTPYQPFGEALAAQLQVPGGRRSLGPLAGELIRLVPDLENYVPGLPPALQADADAERTKLFDAVAGWLGDTAAQQPVLLVLDDLHWADHGTLLLMRHVAVNHPVAKVLVLGTYRDTDVDRRHPLQSMLAELRRRGEVERIALEGLADDEIVELMTAAAGHELEADGLTLAHAVYGETAGNPFFVGEVLRHLAESGAITQQDGTWVAGHDEFVLPEGVRDVVGRRVSALPDDTQRLLETGSVVGAQFDLDVIAAVAGHDEDTVVDLLDPAIAAHLVEETGIGTYRFSHALVRSTLHQELSSTRRSRLHRKTAEALEKLRADDDLLRAGELAYHWSEASSAGEAVRAIEAARHAAELAMKAAAPIEAARWFEHALDMVDEDNVRERIDLMILGTEARLRGGLAEAQDDALEAARMAESIDDVELMTRALRLNVRTNLSIGEAVNPERIELLERAIDLAGDAVPEVQGPLLCELAIELIYTGDVKRRAELALKAEELIGQMSDPIERYRADTRRGHGMPWSMHTSQRARARLEGEDHSVVLAAEDVVERFDALSNEFHSRQILGDGDRVRDALATLTEVATLSRHPLLEDMIPLWGIVTTLIDGKLDECWQQMEDLEERWTRHGWPSREIYTTSGQFQIARERGLLPFLTSDVLNVDDTDIPNVRSAIAAIVALESGDRDGALEFLERRGRKNFSDVPDDAALPICNSMWSEVAARLQQRAACEVWYDRLITDPDLHFTTGGWYLGSSTRNLGLLASALGDVAEATSWFERAAAEHERMRTPPWLARGLLDWAEHDGAHGRVADARKRVDRAVEVIDDLPLDALRNRAAQVGAGLR
jgi:class 3 adenylate cyclase/tetratricopeptide (TPR) repeat protein